MLLRQMKAGDLDAAASGGEDPGDKFDRGGFACPVRAEKPDNFSLLDAEGEAVQGLEGIVRVCQVLDFNHSLAS